MLVKTFRSLFDAYPRGIIYKSWFELMKPASSPSTLWSSDMEADYSDLGITMISKVSSMFVGHRRCRLGYRQVARFLFFHRLTETLIFSLHRLAVLVGWIFCREPAHPLALVQTVKVIIRGLIVLLENFGDIWPLRRTTTSSQLHGLYWLPCCQHRQLHGTY